MSERVGTPWHPRRGHIATLSLLLVIGVVSLKSQEAAQEDWAARSRVSKLIQLAQNATWDANKTVNGAQRLTIGVFGRDAPKFELPRGVKPDSKLSNWRRDQAWKGVNVEYIGKLSVDVEMLNRVHILYITEEAANRWPEVQKHLHIPNVLLVSEAKDFIKHGGHVQFIVIDIKTRPKELEIVADFAPSLRTNGNAFIHINQDHIAVERAVLEKGKRR